MENIQLYGPYVLAVILILLSLKIFARTEDVVQLEVKVQETETEIRNLKAELVTYASENFVSKDTYSDNHKALQDQMLQIHQDISDVKNLLIGIVNDRNRRN